MKETINKVEAAAFQLDWAIRLFLDNHAYIPAITLAGAAEEILGEAVSDKAAFRVLKETLSKKTGIDENIVSQDHLNKAKNWLKHWKNLKDDENLELDLEKEAIQYIARAIANLVAHDSSITSETPRYYKWLKENKKELMNGL